MTSPTRVLFIGLDAGDPGLIDEWSKEGLLPNLKRLRERSISGPVSSPAGLGSGAMYVFEVSTPHLDDVVRLEDGYGRVPGQADK